MSSEKVEKAEGILAGFFGKGIAKILVALIFGIACGVSGYFLGLPETAKIAAEELGSADAGKPDAGTAPEGDAGKVEGDAGASPAAPDAAPAVVTPEIVVTPEAAPAK